jgi:hypothetical protein
MELAGIFDGTLVYFTAIWYIALSFGILNDHLVLLQTRKIWQPWSAHRFECKMLCVVFGK